jgi:hypothetical protein
VITDAQRRLLYKGKSVAQLDDDAWHALIKAEGGVESTNDLDNAGVSRVLRRLKKAGFNAAPRKPARRRRDEKIVALPTAWQTAEIEHRYQLLARSSAAAGHPGYTTLEQKDGFNRKCCGYAKPRTTTDAGKILTGQKYALRRYGVEVDERSRKDASR